ncbi:MAG: hypothetical protein JST05_04190 [Acidobacteria bacterium]|nr:hypothetical protein [Acidobacteriota bacterium]
MKLTALFLLASLLPAQQPVRRALAPSPASGWARVVVDDDGADGIWIGDADGRSVPFLWEADAHWSSIPLTLSHPVWGKDAKGQPTGAFTLQAPGGFTRGDREQVKLDFDLQAAATPWACRVEIARRGDGGAFVAMDDAPRFLCDLGPDRRATSLTIPWDADDWRVTLIPVQGEAPKLIGVSASACTLPSELKPDAAVELHLEGVASHPERSNSRRFQYAQMPRARFVGLDLLVKAPTAPVQAMISVAVPPPDGKGLMAASLGSGEVWNLPALGTLQTHIPLEGTADRIWIDLPDGVDADKATALIRHRRLFFPAEAGKAYFLHEGGLAKIAPGALGELPASSRAFYAGAPLALGAAEADPQAVVAPVDPAAKLRRWLPWGVGALVLLLGLWGLRLLKQD